jgi:hypothetical protein
MSSVVVARADYVPPQAWHLNNGQCLSRQVLSSWSSQISISRLRMARCALFSPARTTSGLISFTRTWDGRAFGVGASPRRFMFRCRLYRGGRPSAYLNTGDLRCRGCRSRTQPDFRGDRPRRHRRNGHSQQSCGGVRGTGSIVHFPVEESGRSFVSQSCSQIRAFPPRRAA